MWLLYVICMLLFHASYSAFTVDRLIPETVSYFNRHCLMASEPGEQGRIVYVSKKQYTLRKWDGKYREQVVSYNCFPFCYIITFLRHVPARSRLT